MDLWQYGRFASFVKPRFIHYNEDVYIFQIEATPHYVPALFNVPSDSEGEAMERVFDTSDLVVEHPVHKGYWKIVGRADDQIMMVNAEKTNPVPMGEYLVSHLISCPVWRRHFTQGSQLHISLVFISGAPNKVMHVRYSNRMPTPTQQIEYDTQQQHCDAWIAPTGAPLSLLLSTVVTEPLIHKVDRNNNR